MTFTEQQAKALSAKLNGKFVKTRVDGGRELSYLEGWHVIAEANRIFGFAGWDRETLDARCVWDGVYQGQRKCSYTARVRVKVRIEGAEIVRDGSGAGIGTGPTQAEAHEAALKTAETDAMKRALATFGNAFGLALYDKDQQGVRPVRRPFRFALRSETGDILSDYPEPAGFCSAFRARLQDIRTSPLLESFWTANSAAIRALRHVPELTSDRGQHYADILESLYHRKYEQLAASRAGSSVANGFPYDAAKGDLSTPGEIHPLTSNAATPVPIEREPGNGPVVLHSHRIRDRDHLRFVASLPCLVCGRAPSHAHHIRFAQPRALGRKVSDAWCVPLCAIHHRSLHDAGNEPEWWSRQGIDPLPEAERLWRHSNKQTAERSDFEEHETVPDPESKRASHDANASLITSEIVGEQDQQCDGEIQHLDVLHEAVR